MRANSVVMEVQMQRPFASLSSLVCLALLSAAGAAPAFAQVGSQITISNCAVRHVGGGQVQLQIDYTNYSQKVAQAVDFAVIRSDGLAEVRDLGNFTRGALIQRSWQFPAAKLPQSGAPRCEVLGIIYRNGSVWTNPNPQRS